MDPFHLAASLVPFVIKQLASPLIIESAKIWKVDNEFDELLATYCSIKNKIVIWYGRREIDGTTLDPWFQELEGYLYDTEDLVDDILLLRCQTEAKHKIRDKIFRYFFSIKPLTFGHKIDKLRKELQRLNRMIEKVLGAEISNSQQRPYKSPLSDNMPFVSVTGRDQDKKNIIESLTSLKCDHSGVSIVGSGGIGKTALAGTVRFDKTIKAHFPLILFASVSGVFDIRDILHKLAANYLETSPQATGKSYKKDSILLRDVLPKQRALIILDDLVSVKDEDWQYFKRQYLNSCPGGRILITTLNPKVAEVTNSIEHGLNRMTVTDCENLIKEIGNLSDHDCKIWASEIEAIAIKCQGLPIIANKVGLELSKKHKLVEKKNRIHELKNFNLLDLPEFREVFLSVNINELNLPFHRKRCFTYFSLFQPDYKFKRDELIQFWEVEGFIQPQHTSGSLKLAAQEECFDDMLSRSILQRHPNSDDNEQPIYEMHQFKHQSAHLLASKAFCRVDEGTSNSFSSGKHIRHLALTARQNIVGSLLKDIERCERLRTFRLLHHDNPQTLAISRNFFHKLPCLRLLDLSHTNFSTLLKPKSLSKHLRYLDLSHTDVKELPKHIHHLRALQVLKLKNCSELLSLPKELNQLISLTHLEFSGKHLGALPCNLGELTNLEVLKSFLVGKKEGCKVLELRNMKNLMEIHISGLDNIENRGEAEGAMLSEKQWLKTLVLQWNNANANAKDVLAGLKPPNGLNVLKLTNYGGQELPTWVVSPTCQLVSIYLEDCPNFQALPSLGKLPLLKSLVFRFIDNVTSLNEMFCEEDGVFMHLDLLEFRGMSRLENWTVLKAGDLPSLCVLKIINCQMLLSLPSLAHLGCYIEINNCPKLRPLPEEQTESFHQPLGNDKDEATMNRQKATEVAELVNGNNISQGAPRANIKVIIAVLVAVFSVLVCLRWSRIEQGTNEDQLTSPQHQPPAAPNDENLQAHGVHPL